MSASEHNEEGPRKSGRPHKGDRHKRTLRFKRPVDAALQRAAAAKGMTVQDFLDELIEREVRPYMPPDSPGKGQMMVASWTCVRPDPVDRA